MAPKFRTRPDGTRYPITPKKGKGGWMAVAVVLGVGLGSGVVGADVSLELPASKSGKSAKSKTDSSAQVEVKVDAQVTARVVLRLRQRGFRVSFQSTADNKDCAAHAYGQVREFLREHPCVTLHRALLQVADRRVGVVLVAMAWVQMPDAGEAAALQSLVDRPGSGNITELSRERGQYRNVRFTDQGYPSARDDTVVITVQIQPLAPRIPGKVLNDIARVIID